MRNVSLAALIAVALAPSSALAGASSAEYTVFDCKADVSRSAEASTVAPISSADVDAGGLTGPEFTSAVTSFADRNGDGLITGDEKNAAKRRVWNRVLGD